jgi:uncharacterized membrane protein YphA (DoxX/SURF4 family)
MTNTDRMKSFAPAVLRVGLSLVFLWFGTQQLLTTPMWVKLIPQSVIDMSGLAAETLVRFNGSFEIVFGLCLLFGFYTRITSLLLALHMIHITFIVGYNGVGVRDFGLAMSTVALFLMGNHAWTLDSWIEKRNGMQV